MWYKKGVEAKEALEKAEAISKALREKSVPKLWLKPDEKADVIFVDDDGFWCEVHVVNLGNRWADITCSAGIRPCPICLKENKRPMGVTYFTVIDLRQFVRSDGTVVKHRKVLLPARRTLAKQIFEFKERYGSLVGLRFTLKRYTEKDPNCGIIVGDAMRDLNGKIKVYKLQGDLAVPFNYEVVLAPPTSEELSALGYNVMKITDDIALDTDLDSAGVDFEEEEENNEADEFDLDLQGGEEDIEEGGDAEEDDIEAYLDNLDAEEEEEESLPPPPPPKAGATKGKKK